MKRIPGNRFIEDSTYFVTMTLKGRRPLFTDAGAAKMVLDELQFSRRREEIELYAYVIMPEHVHVIVHPLPPLVLPRWVRRFKTYVAHSLACGSVWMHDYWSEYLWDNRIIVEKIEYVHRNPIRRGLVDEVGRYVWSSAAEYERVDCRFDLVDDFRAPSRRLGASGS